MTRALAAVAAGVVLAVGSAASGTVPAAVPGVRPAGSGPHSFRMWRVQRTGTAPAVLDMTVTAQATGGRDMVLVVEWTGRGAGRRLGRALLADGGDVLPAVYGTTGAEASACPSAPGCALADLLPSEWSFRSGGERVASEFLIVTEDAAVSVAFARPGWRVREVRPTRVTRLMGSDTGATGASAGGLSAEAFRGASAPGGHAGSFAWGVLPCGTAGSGSARLTATPAAKISDPAVACGPETSGEAIASAQGLASHAVTWRIDGTSTGVSEDATRLLVVDLPVT